MTTAFALCSLQHAVDSFEFMITFKTFYSAQWHAPRGQLGTPSVNVDLATPLREAVSL